jgi:hypothetical protein
MSDDSLDKPATKRDLQDAIAELKIWILKREMGIAFAFLGVQITYFFGTLASLWFMLAHYKP